MLSTRRQTSSSQLANTLHVVHYPGIVDEHVDAAMGRNGQIDESLRRRSFGDVALDADDRSATGLDVGDGLIESFGIPVADDEPRTFGGEAPRHREAHAGRCSGNHRDLILQPARLRTRDVLGFHQLRHRE